MQQCLSLATSSFLFDLLHLPGHFAPARGNKRKKRAEVVPSATVQSLARSLARGEP